MALNINGAFGFYQGREDKENHGSIYDNSQVLQRVTVYSRLTYRCLEDYPDLFSNYISITCSPSDQLIVDCDCSEINMCLSLSCLILYGVSCWLVLTLCTATATASVSQCTQSSPTLGGLLPVEDEPWSGEDWPGLCQPANST